MILKKGQEKVLQKIKVGSNNAFVLYHTVEAIVLDSLTGASTPEIVKTMLYDKRGQRSKFLDYAGKPYLEVSGLLQKNEFEMIVIVGEPGAGKTESLSGIFNDEKNERRIVDIELSDKVVPSVSDIIYLNSDNKPATFSGWQYLYFDPNKQIPEINHFMNSDFSQIEQALKITSNAKIKEEVLSKTLEDVNRESITIDGITGKLYHRYILSSKPYIIIMAHLDKIPSYKDVDGVAVVDFVTEQIKVFGNLYNKLDFAGLFNYIYVADKGTRKFLSNTGKTGIGRAPVKCPKVVPNNLYTLITELRTSAIEAFDGI